MNKRLPPLNAMRAFECAARHLSISQAAAELNVTPAAISQQIKLLEQVLDISLFIRQNRQIMLTDAGSLLAPMLDEGFQQLARAVQTLRDRQQQHPLTITAPPSFVAKWLIPRLDDFKHQHAHIDIRIDASIRLVDFEHDDIDVGIRFNTHPDPKLDSTHLVSLKVIPVCSSEFLRKNPVKSPQDLSSNMLLHYETPSERPSWPCWNMWLATMGYPQINTRKGISFVQHEMLIQAAIDGQGVALVPSIYVDKEMQLGTLQQPFLIQMPIDFSYYLVTTVTRARLPRVEAFKKWMQSQLPGNSD